MRLPALVFMISASFLLCLHGHAKGKDKPEYYQLETYYFLSTQQEALIDQYLEKAYLPALHANGVKNIGVFKPVANDTAGTKVVYVLIPLKALKQGEDISEKLQNTPGYQANAAAFLGAPFDAPAFRRKEITLIKAFRLAPKMQLPVLTAPLSERIYELRSYESATDNLYENKVHMFNEGGEITLFKRLGFNAIFYGDVVAGSKMPNLMYMTSFNSLADRNAHWDAFRNSPEWKSLSGNPFYQHNVSKAEVILTKPAPYSDY